MATANTLETSMLNEAFQIIEIIEQKIGQKIKNKVLAIVAAKIAGYDSVGYFEEFEVPDNMLNRISNELEQLYKVILNCSIPASLALCALARENLSYSEQKQKGVYYTDYRLAQYMSEQVMDTIIPNNSIIDMASGTGILLVAVAEKCKKKWDISTFEKWVKNKVYAYDISASALLGIKIAFMSLVSRPQIIDGLAKHLILDDSLLGEISRSKKKFDIIIGNPPWGKVKFTRHMYMKACEKDHIYGSEFEDFEVNNYKKTKDILSEYANKIRCQYKLIDGGELDLYMPFFELAMKKLSSSGKSVILVPAGLIRAQGTEKLRKYLFSKFGNVKITVFDNRDRYFAIDTRFKFLCVVFEKKQIEKTISIVKPTCVDGKVYEQEHVEYSFDELKFIRPDFSVPEIFTIREREIFIRMLENGCLDFEHGMWKLDICREVDMTSSANLFIRDSKEGFPVVEGRMVNSYRLGAKSYVSGQGRSAVWKINEIGEAEIVPQYVIKENDIPELIKDRVKRVRAGFCDIAGQTNERGMMGAVISENTVCGNKVPTILFPGFDNDDGVYLWVAIVNSFVYDWFLRRILTTTVNFFLLKSIPVPNIDMESDEPQKLIKNTRRIASMDFSDCNPDLYEQLRVENDVIVATLYGITYNEMKIVFEDFVLLDRGQPKLEGENHSTITKDLILEKLAQNDADKNKHRKRVLEAKSLGARAYISAELQKRRR